MTNDRRGALLVHEGQAADAAIGRLAQLAILASAEGRPIAEGGVGYSCLAELRTVETLTGGAPNTPFLQARDVVRIQMRDARRHTIFGAIEQEVAGP